MAIKVALLQISGHRRSRIICEAMHAGIKIVGDYVRIYPVSAYQKTDQFQVVVFYGLEGRLEHVLKAHPGGNRAAVYIDLGYWGRHAGGRWTGYHKVSVNSRHPTSYFQAFEHPSDRLDKFGVIMQRWRTAGRYILLAGMGDKGAKAEGFRPEQWERQAIADIRKVTDRPILYRPKPSWRDARPIEGTDFSPREIDISYALAHAYAVVTHHSNVGVDALVSGIPVFSWAGVASTLASQNLSEIDSPRHPEGREQWARDIAYTQFSIAEMARGVPWRHLKNEGLVPT